MCGGVSRATTKEVDGVDLATKPTKLLGYELPGVLQGPDCRFDAGVEV